MKIGKHDQAAQLVSHFMLRWVSCEFGKKPETEKTRKNECFK